MDQFVTGLLASLPKTTLKAVKYEKIQEHLQDKHEKPSQLLDSLTKALSQSGSWDSRWEQLLRTYFFSQSFPDIRKLKHLEKGPLTPWAKVLAMAFKVFHGWDEKVWKQKDPILRKDFWLALATAQAPWPPKAQEPLCSCFKCGQRVIGRRPVWIHIYHQTISKDFQEGYLLDCWLTPCPS